MSLRRRLLRWAGAGVGVLSLVMVAVSMALTVRSGSIPLGEISAMMVAFSSFTIVGAVIVLKRPTNPVGWSLLMITLFGSLAGVASEYGLVLGRAGGFDQTSVRVLAWIGNWVWWVAIVLIPTFPLLLFPDGKPPSPRWRWAVYLAGAALVTGIVAFALPSGPIELGGDGPMVPSLFPVSLAPVADALAVAAFPMALAAAAASIVSLIVRFRRAHGEERQQIKWVAFAGFIMTLFFFLGAVIEPLGDNGLVFGAAITPVAVATGVAILRYRLYDIDVIINRTLVYGVLTTALLSAYLVIVVSLSRLLDPVTRDSDLAIATSTLVVAALFRPLRARVQGFIDRRFYRTRYNATKSLEAFSARLRDEVELDAVRDDILGVVTVTLHPAEASLWLRPAEPERTA